MTADKFAVTIGLKGSSELYRQGLNWAHELSLPFLSRRHKDSLEKMRREHGLAGLLVATRKGPQVYTEEGILRYSPGMAVLRLQELKRGGEDHFVSACALSSGKRVLDCTLGLGADAAIASCLVGTEGLVVGVEASPVIWKLTSVGMRSYNDGDPDLVAALHRIKPVLGEAEEYLMAAPDDSFDVVYMDPMFQKPVEGSSNMLPLRPAACHKEPTMDTIREALRVAPLVVIKERYRGFLQRLGASEFEGGRYSRVKYGIIRREI